MGYILVNPRISNSTFESSRKDSMQAAEDIWSKLSENIKYFTPKYYFTIQNKKNSKLIHFEINEEMQGGDESNESNDNNFSNKRIKCTISEFKNADNKNVKKFMRELKKEQEGGGTKFLDNSSSSSSSSSSSIVYNIPSSAILPTDLFPLTYFPSIYGIPTITLPTFATSLTPFIRVTL